MLDMRRIESSSPVGGRIRAVLDRLGHTQMWLSEQLGVSTNATTKWVQSGGISRENLERVAKLLGVSTDWLLTGEDRMSPEALEIARAWTQLPAEMREQVKGFIAVQLAMCAASSDTTKDIPQGSRKKK